MGLFKEMQILRLTPALLNQICILTRSPGDGVDFKSREALN